MQWVSHQGDCIVSSDCIVASGFSVGFYSESTEKRDNMNLLNSQSITEKLVGPKEDILRKCSCFFVTCFWNSS